MAENNIQSTASRIGGDSDVKPLNINATGNENTITVPQSAATVQPVVQPITPTTTVGIQADNQNVNLNINANGKGPIPAEVPTTPVAPATPPKVEQPVTPAVPPKVEQPVTPAVPPKVEQPVAPATPTVPPKVEQPVEQPKTTNTKPNIPNDKGPNEELNIKDTGTPPKEETKPPAKEPEPEEKPEPAPIVPNNVTQSPKIGPTNAATASMQGMLLNGGQNDGVTVSASVGHSKNTKTDNDATAVGMGVTGTISKNVSDKTSIGLTGGVSATNVLGSHDNASAINTGARAFVNHQLDGGKTTLTAGVGAIHSGGNIQSEVRNATIADAGVSRKISDDTNIFGGIQGMTGKTGDGQKLSQGGLNIGVDHKINQNFSVLASLSAMAGNGVQTVAGAVGIGYKSGDKIVPTRITIGDPVIVPKQTITPQPVKNPEMTTISLKSEEMFAHDKSNISAKGIKELDGLVAKLTDPKLLASGKNILDELKDKGQKINLAGFTDATGSNKYNEDLSKARLISIKSYLMSKGIDGNILDTSAHGETKAKFDDAAVKEMRKQGMSRAEIHEKISGDRRVDINIPGSFAVLKNDTPKNDATTPSTILDQSMKKIDKLFASGDSNLPPVNGNPTINSGVIAQAKQDDVINKELTTVQQDLEKKSPSITA